MTIIIKHDDGNDKFICKSGDKHRQQSSERDDDDIGHRDKQKSLYKKRGMTMCVNDRSIK